MNGRTIGLVWTIAAAGILAGIGGGMAGAQRLLDKDQVALLPEKTSAAMAACGVHTVSLHVKAAKAVRGAGFPIIEAPPAGKALVYLVTDYGDSTTLRVGADGRWVGALKGGMHLSFAVYPGVRHLCIRTQNNADLGADEEWLALLRLDAVAGKTYYVAPRARGLLTVDEDEGQMLVQTTDQAVWRVDR
jgi:hypothetical protein